MSNPETRYAGKLADPQWRLERSRKAVAARESLDNYVAKIAARAPELTSEQRDKLAVLLRGDAS